MGTPRRVLLAGAWRFEFYEAAFAAALERRGVEVHPFSWDGHLRGPLGRAQEKWLLPGPGLARACRDLVRAAVALRPDVIFIWRGTIVDAGTVEALRRATGAMLVSYNNDDPFSWRHQRLPRHHERSWRRYLDAVPSYDVHFVYRPINVTELQQAGARAVHVLKPYFVPHLHRPVSLTEDERARLQSMAVFAGHFEDDGRAECIRALVEAGVDVRVFGGDGWRQALRGIEERVGPIAPALGDDYTRAICAARAGLCFLSRLNRDSYTRRCFEIPACGTVLVSERTADLAAMFRDGDEAVFFSTRDELVEKVRWLAGDAVEARRIAAAGLDRVHRDRHSVDGRVQEWLDVLTANPARLSATS